MNKFELIQFLKEQHDLTQAHAQTCVDTFFDAMSRALAAGDRVEIRGLCAFKVKQYKAYTGRNPKSGEHVTVKPKKLPFFKPGADLRKRVDR